MPATAILPCAIAASLACPGPFRVGLSDPAFCAGSRQSRSATRSIPASSRACATWSAVSLGKSGARSGGSGTAQAAGRGRTLARACERPAPTHFRAGGRLRPPAHAATSTTTEPTGRPHHRVHQRLIGLQTALRSGTDIAPEKCGKGAPGLAHRPKSRLALASENDETPALAGASPRAPERIRTSDLGFTGR